MRVCLVVPYDIAEEGGVKRHALHLAAALRHGGDEVEIIAPLSRGTPPPHVYGVGGVVNIPANGSANYMALLTPPWSVARFFATGRFDVVHFHEPVVPMLSYYALWSSARAAHVATFHMYAESEPPASRVARAALGRMLFPSFEAAIAVSPAAADFAAPFWRRPMHVVPNGVPTGIFRPAAPSLNGNDGALHLLFVGNWRDSRKGLPVLLDACRELQRLGLRYALDVIGEGTPSTEQRSVPGVTFLGSVASESVLATKYQSCDVFVAPATGQESFGIVLVEAMACARPVVCSDIRGFRDVVDPEGACLVPPGDAAALARALAELARSKERRVAMGLRNRVRAEEFDWDRIASRVRAVYVEAMAG